MSSSRSMQLTLVVIICILFLFYTEWVQVTFQILFIPGFLSLELNTNVNVNKSIKNTSATKFFYLT